MKTNINLYQSSCYLEKVKATWEQMLLFLSVCFLCIIFLKLYLDNKSDQMLLRSQEIQSLLVTKEKELSLLSLQFGKQQMPVERETMLWELEKKIEFHNNILKNITFDHSKYSIIMNELFLSKIDSISIENLVIKNGTLDIYGKAINPNSVPLWLLNMQNKKLLSEQSFDNFTLSGSDGQFRFNLKTKKAD